MFKFTCILCIFFGLYLQATEIYIHYDAKWGNSISIRGNAASLNWEKGKEAQSLAAGLWRIDVEEDSFEFKPLINDSDWSVGQNYKVEKKEIIHIFPFFYSKKGKLQKIVSFASEILGNERTLRIYLPPSYNENMEKSYPVLYMHDGQNLFEAETAFGGVEWRVDETIDSLVISGKIRETIVVGMDNAGANRIKEYTPSKDKEYGGGEGDLYLDFVETEVIPFINAKYRTLKGKENTFLMGSSLGGLISFYAGWTRNDVFGNVGCLSSSFWWNEEQLTIKVENSTIVQPARFYLDSGGKSDGKKQTFRMKNALQNLGYKQSKDMFYFVDDQGKHSESSWAKRLNIPLYFLLKK